MEARANVEHADWSAFPYLEDADEVVSVQRGPEPGGLAGAYRAFGETLRGMRTTMGRLMEGPVTIQYPEEKTPVNPGFPGRHKPPGFEATGLGKAAGCPLSPAPSPPACIPVVPAGTPVDDQSPPGG